MDKYAVKYKIINRDKQKYRTIATFATEREARAFIKERMKQHPRKRLGFVEPHRLEYQVFGLDAQHRYSVLIKERKEEASGIVWFIEKVNESDKKTRGGK